MKIVLAGYYGYGNLGDEAILEALISGIRHIQPGSEITVLSADPPATEECYKVKAVKRFSIIKVIRAIRSADAFIMGGGGILQDVTSGRSLNYYLLLIWLAKFFKKRSILLGQGIGPLKGSKLLKHILRNIDLITVRDEESLNDLVKAGVAAKKTVLTADLSFLLEPPLKGAAGRIFDMDGIKKCRAGLIGVSVRPPVKNPDPERIYREVACICDRLIKEKDSQVVFLIFKYPDDMVAANKVMKYMKNQAHVLFRRCRPSEMLAAVSGLDAVIGMRLHSLIFSSIAKVPSIGISYDPKVTRFQKLVKMPVLDINDITGGDAWGEIEKLIEEKPRGSYDADILMQRSKMNLALLNECLMKDKIRILDVDIDNVSMQKALARIDQMLKTRNHNLIVTPNPEMIIASQNDLDIRNIINTASLAAADGVGLMLAARMLGRKFKERIAGIDLMLKIIDLAEHNNISLFLFGGKQGVADEAAKRIKAKVVGTHQGFFYNDRDVVDLIKRAKPDILFVGLGSPKQEKWASKHFRELGVPLIMCVGGSLDVISGRVKRAPSFMRKIGLEWLWRLILEPKRWRRMLNLPLFLMKVICSKFF